MVYGASPAAGTASTRPFRPRLTSSGSFHAGDIFPTFDTYDSYERHDALSRRRSTVGRRQSVAKYHTFPTPPPKAPSEAATIEEDDASSSGSWWPRWGGPTRSPNEGGEDDSVRRDRNAASITPLPVKQLALLALLSLAEQTALNSIAPYLPTMVASFDEIPATEMGLYVGLLASAFALAQLATNLFWGYLSDMVGRKPVILAGSTLLMICFLFFGFCKTYWQVVIIHVAMGLLNGNAAVVPTCLGEVTDRTNQSSAFTWLPVMYSIGSITGPALGGLLVGNPDAAFPFLAPNIFSAVLLGWSVVVLAIWFDETLDGREDLNLPESWLWVGRLWNDWCCMCFARSTEKNDQFVDVTEPLLEQEEPHDDEMRETTAGDGVVGNDRETEVGGGATRGNDEGEGAQENDNGSNQATSKRKILRELLNRKTVILLLTYLVFQLSNISFNSLYPIFSAAPAPTGRDLPPGQIGLLLSFAGFATIAFQIVAFQPLKARLGNLGSYRGALCGLALSMLLMPWVAHKYDPPLFRLGKSKWWMYAEMATVLVFKNICAVGGLSSVMLLITNSAPSNETLGTLNGVAQTLSAAGRSVGPFLSGALFTLSTGLRPKGEMLAWWIFGGVSMLGWLGSLTIQGRGLESADWNGHNDNDNNQGHDGPRDEETL